MADIGMSKALTSCTVQQYKKQIMQQVHQLSSLQAWPWDIQNMLEETLLRNTVLKSLHSR